MTNQNKYLKYYNSIIERGKTRDKLMGYVEKHHIIPRCMGGSDDTDNLVELTPEEHFTCHLLLTKIYPDNSKLLCAAHLMSGMSVYNPKKRNNNKRYAKLRKKYALTKSKPKPPREELYKLYVIDEMSSPKIAKIYDIDTSTCLEWLRYYNIDIRKIPLPKKYDIDENELLNLYLIDKLSIKDILKYYNCGYPFVKKLLLKNHIPLLAGGTKRKLPPPPKDELLKFYYDDNLTLWEIAEIYGVTKTPVARWFRNYNITRKDSKTYFTIPTPPYEELLELYVNRKQSLSDIALRFGAKTSHTAKKWMQEYNIPIRSRNEQNKFKQYRVS